MLLYKSSTLEKISECYVDYRKNIQYIFGFFGLYLHGQLFSPFLDIPLSEWLVVYPVDVIPLPLFLGLRATNSSFRFYAFPCYNV